MSQAVSAELRAAASRRNLGVRELAALSRLPYSTVSKTLNAKRVVDVEELGRLAHGIGIEPAEIVRNAEIAIRRHGSAYFDTLAAADAADLARWGLKPSITVVPPAEDVDTTDEDWDVDLDAPALTKKDVDLVAKRGQRKADQPAAD
jgi:transcriptional regulator with XRE-family HTH domain